MSEPSLRIEDLRYRYPDGREALRGVDLALEPGSSVALIGPNGAGKSTLLLHINGILPGRRGSVSLHDHGGGDVRRGPEKPAVWVGGLEVNEKNAREVRRRVGLLFQDPDDQLFCTSVLEDVAFGPLNLGMGKAEATRVALECLGRVGLEDASGRPPHHLSFGERKRVCLAGVLACSPSLLVLDEPTANLDPRARRRFIELIDGLEATKLIATHDLEMALDSCERAALIDGGRIVAFGPSREVLSDEALLVEHGLELPVSVRLGRG